jgi:hypothetical protein
MTVDLRLPEHELKKVVDATVDATREVRPIFRYLLTPVALSGYVLAAWRFGSDVGWTDEFFISRGLLSHWQVWLAMAVGVQFAAGHLDRLRAASSSSGSTVRA